MPLLVSLVNCTGLSSLLAFSRVFKQPGRSMHVKLVFAIAAWQPLACRKSAISLWQVLRASFCLIYVHLLLIHILEGSLRGVICCPHHPMLLTLCNLGAVSGIRFSQYMELLCSYICKRMRYVSFAECCLSSPCLRLQLFPNQACCLPVFRCHWVSRTHNLYQSLGSNIWPLPLLTTSLLLFRLYSLIRPRHSRQRPKTLPLTSTLADSNCSHGANASPCDLEVL